MGFWNDRSQLTVFKYQRKVNIIIVFGKQGWTSHQGSLTDRDLERWLMDHGAPSGEKD